MEHLEISLEFDADWTKTAPLIVVKNSDTVVVEATEINAPTVIDFTLDLESNLDFSLCIHRSGHDGANQQICKLLSFKVDGIDISSIMDHGKFYPEYPEPWFTEQKEQNIHWPEYHLRWREWGWNGVWKLDYNTPFYTWLLKMS